MSTQSLLLSDIGSCEHMCCRELLLLILLYGKYTCHKKDLSGESGKHFVVMGNQLSQLTGYVLDMYWI